MPEREVFLESMRAYVRTLADLMTLKDWRVLVDDEVADDGNNAQVSITYGQKHARIWFSWDFATKPAEERRYTVVHELLHCHFDMADRIAGHGLKKGQRNAVLLALEHGVDDVARALAPHLPLPPVHEATPAIESTNAPTPGA